MSPEVKERAEALAEALAQSDEFKAWQKASEELEEHEAAKIMLRDFRTQQEQLQRQVMAGQNPTEQDVAKLQEAYQLVAANPYVRKVIEAEAVFSATLAQIQNMLAQAVGLDADDGEADDSDAESAADDKREGRSRLSVIEGGDRPSEDGSGRSRLWVPGQD